jgi:4-hydroxy-3-polyprenylbenzoate decarboxylase
MTLTVESPKQTQQEAPFDDLRSFIDASKSVERNWREILGANWDQEIGALTETTAELIAEPPMLLFDEIKDYPKGYRVASLVFASYRRCALLLGLPLDRTRLELVRLATTRIRTAQPLPPRVVPDGPVMQNVAHGADIDLLRFPVPRYHMRDGGRYIGTGDTVLNRDPESGFVNMGTYRVQVHEPDLLGLWMSPGQDGRLICQRYWERGESCPIVVTFGGDLVSFMASHTKSPWGRSELDFAGGLRGRPVDVITGPLTGLPIPAHAEIAIEGEVPPPDVEARAEGPFGEWPGYYSGGTRGTGKPQPVIRVKALYYRDDPIILNEAPLWPGAVKHGLAIHSGVIWDQLEAAGIPGITGVYQHSPYMVVVAIEQRYAGHAKQAGFATLAAAASARNGRYIVIVDEDIDPTNMKEVLWAMQTRVDPASTIELIDGAWSTPLDPRMPPDKRVSGDHTNSRAIFLATRPWEWRDQFPLVSRTEKELRRQIVEKYSGILPFPPL